ncbi:MAG: aldo/keto reductase [Deltaproteobacteria bacterium]|nr:aldo/keto reductase [Deltaproteobacteria bacterium]
MKKRKLGKTGMRVSALGFGGSEIGYQSVAPPTVKKMLNSALDAGFNVIDTAECYVSSEELIGQALAGRRKEYYLFTKCGHFTGWGQPDWRPPSLLKSIERSLRRLKLKKGDVIEALKRARERGHARYIGYSGDGRDALYAIECGEFDTLQTSVSLADQEALELTLPLARERNIGVIAKRPIANAAWKSGNRKPADSYAHPYWKRLRKLNYDFLHGKLSEASAIALRFTLSVPGVHTAIVGTTKPKRIQENAAILEAGPLPKDLFEKIRSRWHEVADGTWAGET